MLYVRLTFENTQKYYFLKKMRDIRYCMKSSGKISRIREHQKLGSKKGRFYGKMAKKDVKVTICYINISFSKKIDLAAKLEFNSLRCQKQFLFHICFKTDKRLDNLHSQHKHCFRMLLLYLTGLIIYYTKFIKEPNGKNCSSNGHEYGCMIESI